MSDHTQLTNEQINRYKRHLILPEVGTAGQLKLLNAKVLCIGAGGLGCPISMYLAAAGVGTIGLVDIDIVSPSNLQRQVLFGMSTIGIDKVKAGNKTKILIRFLALTAVAHCIYFFCYNVFAVHVGLNQNEWPQRVQERSYFLNGVCGEPNNRLCYGTGNPNNRENSAYVGSDGKLRPGNDRLPNSYPVLEGKHVQPFRVNVDQCRFELAEGPRGTRVARRPRVAYRDIASATNRVTLIAAIIPARAVTTHTLLCLRTPLPMDSQHVLCGLLNSLVANYLIRLRVNTHVTVSLISRLPVPVVDPRHDDFRRLAQLSRALMLGDGPAESMIEYAQLQALTAHLYGLDEDDLEGLRGRSSPRWTASPKSSSA